MGDLQIKVRCWICQGDGIYQDSTCPSCNGSGKLDTPEGISSIDITEITDKLDSIVVEQAAQRGDLTAALTAIWNKLNE